MSKLGAALGFGSESASSPAIAEDIDEMDAEVPSEKPAGGSAETLAMKQFMRATTPEAKASAMRDFLEACGAVGTDDGAY